MAAGIVLPSGEPFCCLGVSGGRHGRRSEELRKLRRKGRSLNCIGGGDCERSGICFLVLTINLSFPDTASCRRKKPQSFQVVEGILYVHHLFDELLNCCTGNFGNGGSILALASLVDAGRLEEALVLLQEMINKDHGADSLIYNKVPGGYVQQEDMLEALNLFEELYHRCLVYDGGVNATLMEAMDSSKQLMDWPFRMEAETCRTFLEVLLKVVTEDIEAVGLTAEHKFKCKELGDTKVDEIIFLASKVVKAKEFCHTKLAAEVAKGSVGNHAVETTDNGDSNLEAEIPNDSHANQEVELSKLEADFSQCESIDEPVHGEGELPLCDTSDKPEGIDREAGLQRVAFVKTSFVKVQELVNMSYRSTSSVSTSPPNQDVTSEIGSRTVVLEDINFQSVAVTAEMSSPACSLKIPGPHHEEISCLLLCPVDELNSSGAVHKGSVENVGGLPAHTADKVAFHHEEGGKYSDELALTVAPADCSLANSRSLYITSSEKVALEDKHAGSSYAGERVQKTSLSVLQLPICVEDERRGRIRLAQVDVDHKIQDKDVGRMVMHKQQVCDLGLEVELWIKTSLVHDFGVVSKYLQQSGLQKCLDQQRLVNVAGVTDGLTIELDFSRKLTGGVVRKSLLQEVVALLGQLLEGREQPDTACCDLVIMLLCELDGNEGRASEYWHCHD